MPDFCEHAAKPLLLRAGLRIPAGEVAASADEAAALAERIGPCMVKAQIPAGGRGKAGGIKLARTSAEAREAARSLLDMDFSGRAAKCVLVEELIEIEKEYYAAVTVDPVLRCPVVLFSASGGVDIESAADADPRALLSIPVDIADGLDEFEAARLLGRILPAAEAEIVAEALAKLYRCYRRHDAELLEVNPLAVRPDGNLIALDCKFTMDDAAVGRQSELAATAEEESLTKLEAEAAAAGLKFIELDGNVGILANGAGLTMATMDVIKRLGGSPANFLEIGGDAYSKAETAWNLLLGQKRIASAVVNFCGAFARTDVMAQGVATAWKSRPPWFPVHFCIHGTGEREAISLVRRELGIEPFEHMEDAIEAAVSDAEKARK